jgi:hypothetical protein
VLNNLWTIHLLAIVLLQTISLMICILSVDPTHNNNSNRIRGFKFTGDNNYLASSASLPPLLTDPNMMPSSYAWQGGGINTNNINTHFSTAILPQLCSTSTGLMDESGLHASRIQSSNFNNQLTSSSRRYPPPAYYDYSNFPSLGSVYDIPEPNNIQVVSFFPTTVAGIISDVYS